MIEYKAKLNFAGEKHRMFQSGDIVRHFKGNLYQILDFARHTETGELLVVYQCLYDSYSSDGKRMIYARPYKMFEEVVDKEKYSNADQEYRFEIVEIQNVLDK
jgi:hypothetical protein